LWVDSFFEKAPQLENVLTLRDKLAFSGIVALIALGVTSTAVIQSERKAAALKSNLGEQMTASTHKPTPMAERASVANAGTLPKIRVKLDPDYGGAKKPKVLGWNADRAPVNLGAQKIDLLFTGATVAVVAGGRQLVAIGIPNELGAVDENIVQCESGDEGECRKANWIADGGTINEGMMVQSTMKGADGKLDVEHNRLYFYLGDRRVTPFLVLEIKN
jgi:hypothetical protein